MTRKERLERRRVLARLLIDRGISPGQAHSDIGYMFNRAPVRLVEVTLRACIDDPDPVASSLEVLAEALEEART